MLNPGTEEEEEEEEKEEEGRSLTQGHFWFLSCTAARRVTVAGGAPPNSGSIQRSRQKSRMSPCSGMTAQSGYITQWDAHIHTWNNA